MKVEISENGNWILKKGDLEIPLLKDERIGRTEVQKALFLAADIIDFKTLLGEVFESWDREELEFFIDKMPLNQKTFLRVLSERPDIKRDDLIKQMNNVFYRVDDTLKKIDGIEFNTDTTVYFDSALLAGATAGISRKTNSRKKEKIFTIENDIYRINEDLRKMIVKILKDLEARK